MIEEYTAELNPEDQNFCKEPVLWALTINNKLDKSENEKGIYFRFYRYWKILQQLKLK